MLPSVCLSELGAQTARCYLACSAEICSRWPGGSAEGSLGLGVWVRREQGSQVRTGQEELMCRVHRTLSNNVAFSQRPGINIKQMVFKLQTKIMPEIRVKSAHGPG